MVVAIKEYTSEDAAALSQMFYASDLAWPDGFDDGVLYSPEALIEEDRDRKWLNAFLAWADDKVVGYVDMMSIPNDDKAAYVGLLNSHPDYHGRGVGRDLLLRVIERCVELRLNRVTLGTWMGNSKAVPLYKKTGYFWGPDAEGWDELQNHVPLLLSHPLTKPYFDRTNWYKTLMRDLSLGLDKEKRHGALVFPYCFEGDAGVLRAVFDQKSKKLVELDTPELLVSLTAVQSELLSGREQLVRLAVSNRRASAVTVGVVMSGDGPIEVEGRKVFIVEPGASHTVEFKATASDEKTGDGAVKAALLLDGVELETAATVKVAAQFELALEPSSPPLRPGIPTRVALNVRNRTDAATKGRLLVATSSDLAVEPATHEVSLEPGQASAVPLVVTATRSGAHTLTVSALREGADAMTAPPTLTTELSAAAPGEMVVARDGDSTSVHTDSLVFTVPNKGYEHSLTDRRSGVKIARHSMSFGRPYWPNESEEQESEVSVENGQNHTVLTMRTLLKEPKGLRVERRYSVSGDGRVSFTISAINLAGEVRNVGVRLEVSGETSNADYFPIAEGVIRGIAHEPSWKWGGAGSQPSLTEGWSAFERDPWTVGLLWTDEIEPRAMTWTRLVLRGRQVMLAPGERLETPEIVVLPTLGGWRAVQREWHVSRGSVDGGAAGSEIPVGRIETHPSPVTLSGDTASLEIRAVSTIARPTNGMVRLEVSDGLKVEPSELEFESVNVVNSPTDKVAVEAQGDEPFAGRLTMHAVFPGFRSTHSASVVRLGSSGGEVRVNEAKDAGEPVWKVDNGWMQFGVRPGVIGSIYTLTTPEGERLYVSFPEPVARHWWYPYYGGIRPLLHEAGGWTYEDQGRLDDVVFNCEPTDVVGASGVHWEGLKLGADVRHEKLTGLRFEIEYLTTAGSNVLAVRSTVRSLGPSRRVGYVLQLAPTISPEIPNVYLPDQWEVSRGPLIGDSVLRGKRWVCSEYPTSGQITLLVSAAAGGVEAALNGPEGAFLGGVLEETVPPGGRLQTLHYIVFARDKAQAMDYTELRNLTEL